MKVLNVTFSAGVGALSLLPVSWLLALERAEPQEEKGDTPFDILSYQRWARIGLRGVILPGLQRYLGEDWPLQDVVAELARRTVDQHLRVSWARLSQDPTRDVAVMTSDGDRWSYRSDFYAGRTAPRLYQAIGWLWQLRLIDDGGLTRYGRAVLQGALQTLEGNDRE